MWRGRSGKELHTMHVTSPTLSHPPPPLPPHHYQIHSTPLHIMPSPSYPHLPKLPIHTSPSHFSSMPSYQYPQTHFQKSIASLPVHTMSSSHRHTSHLHHSNQSHIFYPHQVMSRNTSSYSLDRSHPPTHTHTQQQIPRLASSYLVHLQLLLLMTFPIQPDPFVPVHTLFTPDFLPVSQQASNQACRQPFVEEVSLASWNAGGGGDTQPRGRREREGE